MMTAGRAALLAALLAVRQVDLARRLGVSRPILSQWASGARRPAYAGRVALDRELGIPLDAWDRPYVAPANSSGVMVPG